MKLFVSSTTDCSECWTSQKQSFLLKKLTIVLKIGQYKGTWRMTFLLKYYLQSFLLNWSSMNIRNPFVHLESKINEFYITCPNLRYMWPQFSSNIILDDFNVSTKTIVNFYAWSKNDMKNFAWANLKNCVCISFDDNVVQGFYERCSKNRTCASSIFNAMLYIRN